jgi:hypothetical protein
MRGLKLRPGLYRLGAAFRITRPLPIADSRHVLAVLIDIDLVLNELVLGKQRVVIRVGETVRMFAL